MLSNIKTNLPLFFKTMRKPLIYLYMVTAIGHIRLFFAISIISLFFIVPPVIQSVGDKIFPPHKEKKILGFIKQKNDTNDLAKQIGLISCYLLIIAGNGVVIILNLPNGIKAAQKFSGKSKNKADENHSNSRIKFKLLYLIAWQLTLDKNESTEIKSKLFSSSNNSPLENNIESTQAVIVNSNDFIDANNRYEIKSNIGRGAMGLVHLGYDNVLEREIAIKEIPPYLIAEEETINRFKLEATALAKISHPNIVQVYDLVIKQDHILMILEYVKGVDLNKYLSENGPMDVALAIEIFKKMVAGLSAAHENNIVHRDIKPANILLNEKMEPKIADFGIVRLSEDSSLTQEGLALGSPPYMSPEQCSGNDIDNRSDIYSMGITFYEMLTGSKPFEGQITSVLSQHLNRQPQPPSKIAPHLSVEIDNLILKMLEKDRSDRFQNSYELLETLNQISHSPVMVK